MGVCTRGSQRRERVYPWERDGDCRRTMNGGRWRRPTAVSARIRRKRVEPHTRRSWPEAARDFMRCSAAAAPKTASMRDWKPTDFIGRHPRSIRRTHGTTTSVKAGWLSTVKTVVRRRELFPFAASESDDRMLCFASSEKTPGFAADNHARLDIETMYSETLRLSPL
jgi:hypothetical protein